MTIYNKEFIDNVINYNNYLSFISKGITNINTYIN